MKTSRLKNIIIFILVVANLFLLALVIPQKVAARVTENSVIEALCQFMDASGITLIEEDIPDIEGLPVLEMGERDTDAEAAAVLYLLGETQVQNMGGGLYSYTGDGGEATFRSSGEFTVTLEDERTAIFDSEDALKTLKKMGLDCIDAEYEETDEGTVVTVAQSVDGYELFDCEITLVYDEIGLCSVSGIWCAIETSNVEGETASLSTALSAFLDSRDELGFVCKSIVELAAGYVLDGDGELSPVWCIITDTVTCRVDGSTLEVEIIS